MAGVVFKKTGGSGGGNGIWLTEVTGNGTFLVKTLAVPIAGEAVPIVGFATDSSTVLLTLIGDRGIQYEPTVTVNGVLATRASSNTTSALTDGTFRWTVSVPASESITISTSDGAITVIPVQQEAPAIVSELTIINNPNSNQTDFYRNSQTELKAGDEVYVTFKTDKPISAVNGVALSGANCVGPGVYSGANLTYDVPTEVYTARLTIGRLTASAAQVTIQINTTTTEGAVSSVAATSDNTVNCNNLYPTVTYTNLAYPPTQTALKNSEICTVSIASSNFDSILYSSPNGQLQIPNLSVDEPTKVVTRLSGSYNVTTNNIQAVANRLANDSTTTSGTVVFISNIAPVITVTEPATALRSGGNDGTSVQNYTISVVSTQRLARAPDLVEAVGSMPNMSWSASATTFTAQMSISDTDVKGTYAWGGLLATSMSGLATTVISGDSDVRVEGFVLHTYTMPAFGNTITVNTSTFDLNKISVTWNVDVLTLSRSLTDTTPQPQRFFVSTAGTTTTIHLLDISKTSARSSSSIVTVEETL